ncbi:hypothetical protein GPALN_003435 [Globodera pallida]|nr:hypothetical protein GPALN_003435 [Globodera pallida]
MLLQAVDLLARTHMLLQAVDLPALLQAVDLPARTHMLLQTADLSARTHMLLQAVDLPALLQTADLLALLQTADILALLQTADILALLQTADLPAMLQTADLPAMLQTADLLAMLQTADLLAQTHMLLQAADLPVQTHMLLQAVDLPALLQAVDLPARTHMLLQTADLSARTHMLLQAVDLPALLQTADLLALLQTADILALLQTADILALLQTADLPAMLQTADLPAMLQTADLPARTTCCRTADLLAQTHMLLQAVDLPVQTHMLLQAVDLSGPAAGIEIIEKENAAPKAAEHLSKTSHMSSTDTHCSTVSSCQLWLVVTALAEHARLSKQYNNDANKLAELQRLRRREHLERPNLTHEEWLQRFRPFEDAQTNAFASRINVSRDRDSCTNILMYSEWLVDVPDTLATKWTMVPLPKGRRALVVANKGKTRVLFENGAALFEGHSTKLYILDLLMWDKKLYTQMDFVTRRSFLQKHFKEMKANLAVVPTDPTKSFGIAFTLLALQTSEKFVLLPSCVGSTTQIGQFMHNKLPYQLEGLLFYYNSAFYIPGQTPLVGWTKPGMLPEIIGVPVPEQYTQEDEKRESD